MAKPPHHSFGPVFGSLRTQLTIGIRREDPTRIWERRAPLTPDTVNYLVSKKNVRVHIESCDRRVFPNREYIKVCILHWSLLILSCPRIRVRLAQVYCRSEASPQPFFSISFSSVIELLRNCDVSTTYSLNAKPFHLFVLTTNNNIPRLARNLKITFKRHMSFLESKKLPSTNSSTPQRRHQLRPSRGPPCVRVPI